MRTDELIRSLEARGQRDPVGVAADGVAERVVAEAHRSALRRHRSQRVAAGGLVALVAAVIGFAGWQALDSRNEAVQVITSPDDHATDDDVPSDDELAQREMEARRAREAERARIEIMQRAERVRELAAIPMVEHNGIGLRVPDGWHTSGENLTPGVSPHPVATFGTAPLPVGGGERCSQYPMAAVLAMGEDDVLVSLIEGASIRSPERGSSLWELAALPNDAEIVDCPEWPEGFAARWYEFADNGRGFYLLVVTGPEVPDSRRIDLAAAVDSIYVEPRYEDDHFRPGPVLEPTSPPPHPLPLTGAIGHPVTINGREHLIGTIGWGSRRSIEITTDDLVIVGASTGMVHNASAMGSDSAWGVVGEPVVRVVVQVGDRRFESEVVALPFDPMVRIWAVHALGGVLRGADEDVRIMHLDADGNELIPAPPDGK